MKNKVVAKVHTKQGMAVKVFANGKTGVVLPANWKQQAGILGAERMVGHRETRRNRLKVAA